MKILLYGAALVIGMLNAVASHPAPAGIINFGNINIATPDHRKIWTYDQSGGLVRVAGSGYSIALYWGQPGTPEGGLVQVGAPTSFVPETAVSFAGTFSGGNRVVSPLDEEGGVVTLQARGWSVIPGVENSYDAVLFAALNGDSRARVGKGPVFDHDTSRVHDPTDPPLSIGAPVSAGGNPGWCGFVIGPPDNMIVCVPEPSTVAVAALAFGSLFFARRRKT